MLHKTQSFLTICTIMLVSIIHPHIDTNTPAFLMAYDLGRSLLQKAVPKDDYILSPLKDDRAYLRDFPFQDYQIQSIPDFGLVYLDNLRDCIKNVLRANRAWESEFIPIMQKFVRPGSLVIDIGAHIGTHTLTMARAVKSGLVIAFEPHDKIFRELYLNMAINKAFNVIPVRAALADMPGIMKIRNDVPDNEGASYLMPDGPGQDVPVVCLDDFNFNNISFIKIDTENTELAVLQGARKTILRNQPIILIEIQGNDVRADRNQENMKLQSRVVMKYLDELGYELHHVTWVEYLAIPKK